MSFNSAQVAQLLKPIAASRVLKDGKGHSHVSQQDVLAHLVRVFGFGNFDIQVLDVECVFETERVDDNGVPNGRWDVCYRAMVRLTVRDEHGRTVCSYENGSTATAQNQTRGDAHDLAYKSAISLSVKRAAIPLGDQFGLSLYNKGQMSALVMGTLVKPDGEHPGHPDLQEGVAQQVSLGNDETDPDEPPEDGHRIVAELEQRIRAATKEQVTVLWGELSVKARARQISASEKAHLSQLLTARVAEVAA